MHKHSSPDSITWRPHRSVPHTASSPQLSPRAGHQRRCREVSCAHTDGWTDRQQSQQHLQLCFPVTVIRGYKLTGRARNIPVNHARSREKNPIGRLKAISRTTRSAPPAAVRVRRGSPAGGVAQPGRRTATAARRAHTQPPAPGTRTRGAEGGAALTYPRRGSG